MTHTSRLRPCRAKMLTRREALRAGGLGLAGAAVGPGLARACAAAAPEDRPNLVLIICDQLGLDAIGACGFADAATPNLDRMVRRGTTFLESHSTSPVCSPARSSMMTGRMPVETGVVSNGRPIHPSRPNLGQWLGSRGYEAVYCGKWHLPGGYPVKIDGFTVLPAGASQGDLSDVAVSNTCSAYLKNRRTDKPLLLVASFMQPHDICYWGGASGDRMPPDLPLPFDRLDGRLPELPPNHTARPKAPKRLEGRATTTYSELMWRYYLYLYARQVEMLDADVGRLLDAVDASGMGRNTVIFFTSDHGDGRARHLHVSKWYPYDEAMKVPLIVSCPGRIAQDRRDAEHLVTGLDIMPTMCDYAGVEPPELTTALSLRPLLEGRPAPWRQAVAAEWMQTGRILRTARHKYVVDRGDPVEMLFDMKADPWEMRNLHEEPGLAGVRAEHRQRLAEWEGRLRPVPPTESVERPAARPKAKGAARPRSLP